MTMRVEGIVAAAPAVPVEWRGRSIVIARLVWVLLVSQAIVLTSISFVARFHQLSHPPADVRAQLTHASLSPVVYAAYLTTVNGIYAFVCCAVAALIIRHRPNDRIGLFGSLYLVLFGLTDSPEMQAVVNRYPGLATPANFSVFLLALVLIGFFFVFPDGRIAPGQARYPLLVAAAIYTVVFVFKGSTVAANPPDWLGQMIILGSVAGISAQIYRYVKMADSVQRQQTKWVVFGAAAAILTAVCFSIFGDHVPTIGRTETGYDLTANTVITIASLLVPLTLGLAILRHRLWDIDVVINRSLVYGALTASLLGLYLAVAEGLGALVQAQGRLPFSLLATAMVALLFAPLRHRLQSAVNRLMYGERDDPYRVLTQVGKRVGAPPAPEPVLQVIAETVAGALKSPHVSIALKQADGLTPAASHGTVGDPSFCLPLEYQGEQVGELHVAPRGPGEQFSPADRRLLEDLARQIGPAAHAVSLTADLQRSRERLVTAREEERRRLRRDLHDGLGPQLATLTLTIETIRNHFADDPALDAALVDLTERTQQALADIRRLVYGLRPPALDELGLLSALQQTVAQYGQAGDGNLQVTLDAPESLPPLPAAIEVAAYRIVQEALVNAARHSAGRTCRLSVFLEGAPNVLCLRIADDGRGLPDHRRAGVGLVSMCERAEELGGRLLIASPPTGGTVVTAELPYLANSQKEIVGRKNEGGPHGCDSHSHRR
ncbi:MAG: histidine kinase [Thermomicrobiales bacterium]